MWYSFFVLSPLGRHDDALAEMRRALDLDPVSLEVRYHLGVANYMARRYDSAIAEYRRALDLDQTYAPARDGLGFSYAALGRFDDAVSEMRRAVADSTVTSDAVLGYVYALAGRHTEARAILRALTERARHQYVIPMDFSLLYTGLGEPDAAFPWLSRAYDERLPLLVGWINAPPNDRLRNDPRFTALVGGLGLDARGSMR